MFFLNMLFVDAVDLVCYCGVGVGVGVGVVVVVVVVVVVGNSLTSGKQAVRSLLDRDTQEYPTAKSP